MKIYSLIILIAFMLASCKKDEVAAYYEMDPIQETFTFSNVKVGDILIYQNQNGNQDHSRWKKLQWKNANFKRPFIMM